MTGIVNSNELPKVMSDSSDPSPSLPSYSTAMESRVLTRRVSLGVLPSYQDAFGTRLQAHHLKPRRSLSTRPHPQLLAPVEEGYYVCMCVLLFFICTLCICKLFITAFVQNTIVTSLQHQLTFPCRRCNTNVDTKLLLQSSSICFA